MAYHGENDPDIPYDATARNRRNTEALWQEIEAEQAQKSYEPRDWAPKPLKSNYCRELVELSTDTATYYDIHVRNEIRSHLAAAGLADSKQGISDWELSMKPVQDAERKQERLEYNRARRYGDRVERN